MTGSSRTTLWLASMSCLLAGRSLLAQSQADSAQLLDAFETTRGWEARPSDGVALALRSDSGRTGQAMRLDFDFQGRGGYASARRVINLTFPENYEFSFWIRGEARPNTLEFKLSDESGDNVWWYTRPKFELPREWQRITIKRRHISYAWGPLGGGDLKHAATLELVVTAAQGGAGTIWIDDLTFRRRDIDRPYDLTPRVTASGGSTPEAVLDGSDSTAWRISTGGNQWLALDFLRPREFGGLIIEWAPSRHARDYAVETSPDGVHWSGAYTVQGGDGGSDFVHLPENESRHLRLKLERGAVPGGYALRTLAVKPVDWAPTPNAFFREVASRAPKGSYPRYFSDQQAYWTVLGASGDGRRGLLNEDGALETSAGGFSVEPFLGTGGRLLTWNDARRTQRLERGDLPIPTVHWSTEHGLELTITAFAAGPAGASSVLARYRVSNRGPRAVRTTLYLTVRPFQVNPPWQFLGTTGGVAQVRRISYRDRTVSVDSQTIRVLTPPHGFGVSSLDRGDAVEHLRTGRLPPLDAITDSAGRASGVLSYPLELAPRGVGDVWLEFPLYPDSSAARLPRTTLEASSYGERRLTATIRDWSGRLDRVGLTLPPSAADLAATIRANLAYILINRDGPAIEPGARSYRRSWIRDGAMISAALLRLKQVEAVKAFLEWYAPYQYPNGKVPCCVDARGADPVPENDSHGQLIYLAMEYFRHTGDTVTLARMWPNAAASVRYIDSLRHSRMTAAYEKPESLAFRGLVPQSISHEGYSAKPMHSYWDDFYILKGLKDATDMANVLGHQEDATRIAGMRDEFRRDLYASIQRAMAAHRIDFIPGSVELGDFDATSTTIAVAPVGEQAQLPDTALRRTFERYWDEFRARRDGTKPWEGYTPYELRTVGTMLRLGWKDRAHEALAWFFGHRRPAAWRQWSEGVFRDPSTPKFIGDMPHTWVGSDFLRSVLDFFAYEQEMDSSIVVGDGLAEKWVIEPPGIAVKGLSTHYGSLTYTMRARGESVVVRLAEGVRMPPGGIVIRSPRRRPVREAVVDGTPAQVNQGREVVIRRLPAVVTFSY